MFVICKYLVWPVEIKRARRKNIEGMLTNHVSFGRMSKNLDFVIAH